MVVGYTFTLYVLRLADARKGLKARITSAQWQSAASPWDRKCRINENMRAESPD